MNNDMTFKEFGEMRREGLVNQDKDRLAKAADLVHKHKSEMTTYAAEIKEALLPKMSAGEQMVFFDAAGHKSNVTATDKTTRKLKCTEEDMVTLCESNGLAHLVSKSIDTKTLFKLCAEGTLPAAVAKEIETITQLSLGFNK